MMELAALGYTIVVGGGRCTDASAPMAIVAAWAPTTQLGTAQPKEDKESEDAPKGT